ncbi:MAG TPA: DUF1579 family protein [Terriglobia bacterium]|jgi:hypothetical protein|nr:DUF1579 family protein [Terriglobia bacterium]
MKWTYFLFLIFTWAAVNAQSEKPPVPVPEHLGDLSSSESKRKAPGTAADLQSLLKALSGKWTVTVKFEPNPSMPNGFEGKGEETWRSGPGGITAIDEEHIPSPGGDLFLLGIIWWDSKMKSFHGMVCDNQLPHTCDLKGALNDITMSWDGKQLVIDEIETHDGKKTLWHEVWSDITPTSFTQTGDISEPGGPAKRFMTIHGTKDPDAK